MPEEPYFVLGPGSTADSRRWSVESYAAFAQKAMDRWKLIPVIVGGPSEVSLGVALKEKLGTSCLDLTDQSSIPQLSRIFKKARFCLTNESGLAHVSALFGCSTYIVCGAADPKRTTPIGPGRVRVMTNPVDCWPCEKNVCYHEGEKTNQCLKGIHADRVHGRVDA